MIIKKYNKVFAEINSLEYLTPYIKEHIYTDINKIPTHLENSLIEILSKKSINKTEFHKKIRNVFSESGKVLSRCQIKYWINRGFNSDEAVDIINKLQKTNSPRHIDYWAKLGFYGDDAKSKISDYQKKNGDANKLLPTELLKKRSIFCKEYWINKGYSDSESSEIIKNIQKKISNNYWTTATIEQKNRHRMVGTLNGMYGKTPPNKSGIGISGWYKGLLFRSLHELNYMVNVLNRFNISFVPAEKSGLRIKYIGIDGREHTYCGDFIVSNKYYVEIKPKILFNTATNKIKKEVATKFCKKINLKYKIVDCGSIGVQQLIKLVEAGDVVFTKNYENRIKQYLCKTEG